MDTRIILYVIAGLLILGLVLLTLFPGIIQAWTDSSKTGTDKCSPAPGYTEAEWREHMSHHPSIYKDCL